MNDISAGLDALQDSIEKRVSSDVQTLEDSDVLLECAEWLAGEQSYFPPEDTFQKWAYLLRRIAIPRPVGELE